MISAAPGVKATSASQGFAPQIDPRAHLKRKEIIALRVLNMRPSFGLSGYRSRPNGPVQFDILVNSGFCALVGVTCALVEIAMGPFVISLKINLKLE